LTHGRFHSTLAALNLPAALEDSEGCALPPSLLDKAAAVAALGGLTALEACHHELPELLQRNRDILDEADRMLREEQQADEQLKLQVGTPFKPSTGDTSSSFRLALHLNLPLVTPAQATGWHSI
jgi:hypothetical protein